MAPPAPITAVRAAAFEFPTDAPESDGTLQWDSTVLVVVEVDAASRTGLGYTYAHQAAVALVTDKLAAVLDGRDAFDVQAASEAMVRECRNLGVAGLASMAISALDVALWDLKARLLDVSLVSLLGPVREDVMVYGSGGFTSYDDDRLQDQLGGWVEQGISRVKVKVGREPEHDCHRLTVARKAVGDEAAVFVDANGAFDVANARRWADIYAREFGVCWFEEPVSSDDLDGLRRVRDAAPHGMQIVAGEYCWRPIDAQRALAAEAVDCLQLDVTRCLGITGFLAAAAVAEAAHVPVSAHCAPQLSSHVSAVVQRLGPLEYFHDHVRIEAIAFDGVLAPVDGYLSPDRTRVGHGLTCRASDLGRFRVA